MGKRQSGSGWGSGLFNKKKQEQEQTPEERALETADDILKQLRFSKAGSKNELVEEIKDRLRHEIAGEIVADENGRDNIEAAIAGLIQRASSSDLHPVDYLIAKIMDKNGDQIFDENCKLPADFSALHEVKGIGMMIVPEEEYDENYLEPPADYMGGYGDEQFVMPPPPETQEEFMAKLAKDKAFQEFNNQPYVPYDDDFAPPELEPYYPSFDETEEARRLFEQQGQQQQQRIVAPNPQQQNQRPVRQPVQPPTSQNSAPIKQNPAPTGKKQPKSLKKQDDEIIITAEMIEPPVREVYEIKDEYKEDLIGKIFERLDLPKIKYDMKDVDVHIEAGGNAPSEIIATVGGKNVPVPLGEHEQNSLENAVEEIEKQKNSKEK